ncbi:hypothetical protein Tco_1028279 [Tanacetum coccineum]|uniref:Uncharacterized protein n=1 Tax=Tanacetum coccineum TaxID=301880 RepID=A0ABQ5G1M0_9ASTR
MDDLYNNFKVYEAEIKSQSSSSSNSHNVAFVSLENTSSTNEAVNTTHDVSGASSQGQASSSTYADDVIQVNENELHDCHLNKGEVFKSASDSSVNEIEEENNQVNDRFKKVEGYHAVPPPYTGNYMPSRPDLSFAGLDDSVYKTNEFDSDDDCVTRPSIEHNKPSYTKINFVKSDENTRKSIIEQNTCRQPENLRKNQSPRIDKRNWNGLMAQKLGDGFEFNKKACFVCGSLNHLIKDFRPVWNNAQRVNHQNKLTHPHPKRNFVPTAVATKSGLVPVNAAKQSSPRAATSISTARQVNTAASKPKVNVASPIKYSYFKAHSHLSKVVSTAEGKRENAVKSSACWIWRPTGKVIDHISKDSGSYMPKRFDYGNPQYALQDQGIFDSGCSRHMTGNKSYLTDYQDIDGGFVAFAGSPKGGKITGKVLRAQMIRITVEVPDKGDNDVSQVWSRKEEELLIKKMTSMCKISQESELNKLLIQQEKKGAHLILRDCRQQALKTASTLIETNKTLVKDEEAEDVDVHLYSLMIGSLMYLTASRPNIMFADCACARDSPFDLEAFFDSDYAGASLDRKFTTRAEYVAAANCCGRVLWIQNQMLDYGFNFMNTKIYIDNESTICIVKNPKLHAKTKHIEIRHHFIRDSYEKKLIEVIKIHTDQNVDDLLTKAFDVSSGPPEKVGDEAVHKELGDKIERAATTASSLEAEQDSGKINRTQSMATLNDPSPEGTCSGSGPRCQDTILGGVDAQTSNMRRDSKGYTGVDTPLFQTMHVQGQILVESHHTPTSTPSTLQPQTSPPSIQTTYVTEEATPMPHDSPLLRVQSLGSNDDSLTLNELTVLCTTLSKRVESLESDLKQTKLTYGAAYTKLILKVKKLENKLKSSKARRRVRLIVSNDEEELEDSSKQGRKIAEIDQDPSVSLVQDEGTSWFHEAAKIQEKASDDTEVLVDQKEPTELVEDLVSTASPEVKTAAESLVYIRRSATKRKDKGKAIMDETEDEQNYSKNKIGLVMKLLVAADEDLVQQLQAGEKYSEEDLPKRLVELVNQRKKYFAQQRAEARRNKCMTQAQQRTYMFPKVIARSSKRHAKDELNQKASKRQKIGKGSEPAEESEELSQEQLHQLMIIVPKEGINVESLQIKYPIID